MYNTDGSYRWGDAIKGLLFHGITLWLGWNLLAFGYHQAVAVRSAINGHDYQLCLMYQAHDIPCP